MECPMCQDLYDDQRLIPRNLPCGHTFCESCIEKVMSLKPAGSRIECPTCREKFTNILSISSLSKNFIALELALKQRKLQSKLQFCETHSEFLIFFCEDCSEHLCTSCILTHSGHRFMRQEHSVILLKERLLSAKEQAITASNVLRNTLTITKQFFSRESQNLRAELAKIDHEFESIIEAIQTRRDAIRQECTIIYEEFLQTMQTQAKKEGSLLEGLNQSIAKISDIQKIIESTKVIKNDDLVKNVDALEEIAFHQIKQAQSLPPQTDSSHLPTFSFNQDIYSHIQEFSSLIQQHPKICFFGEKNSALIYDVIGSEWKKHSIPNMGGSLLSFMSYGSAVSQKNGAILIIGGGKSSNILEVNLQQGLQIRRRRDMPTPRKEHSAVILYDGSVLVMGGYNQQKEEMLESCEMYFPRTDTWREVAPMKVSKCAFAATADYSGKFVYTFGGFDSERRLNIIEKYSIETNTWEILNLQLHKPLSNAAAISHPQTNIIYILGGGHDEGFSKEVFKLTQITINSTEKQQMQQSQQQALQNNNSLLYKSYQEDEPTYALESIAEMSSGKDLRNKVAIFRNCLYTIGGNQFKTERFNLRTHLWESLPSYYPAVADNLDSWTCGSLITSEAAHLHLQEDSIQEISPLEEDTQQKQDIRNLSSFDAFYQSKSQQQHQNLQQQQLQQQQLQSQQQQQQLQQQHLQQLQYQQSNSSERQMQSQQFQVSSNLQSHISDNEASDFEDYTEQTTNTIPPRRQDLHAQGYLTHHI